MNTPFRQFRENHFLFIRILAFGMTLLCGFINATIFLRFDFGGTHQTGNLSKIAFMPAFHWLPLYFRFSLVHLLRVLSIMRIFLF